MKLFLLIFTSLWLSNTSYAQVNNSSTPLLRHVVIFKFKDSSSDTDVKKVSETFAGLYGKIPQIKHFEWGINNSPENLHQGFTHCFTLTFSRQKIRKFTKSILPIKPSRKYSNHIWKKFLS